MYINFSFYSFHCNAALLRKFEVILIIISSKHCLANKVEQGGRYLQKISTKTMLESYMHASYLPLLSHLFPFWSLSTSVPIVSASPQGTFVSEISFPVENLNARRVQKHFKINEL